MTCKINIQNYVILDVEGTTTPVNFVHITLFKYARDSLTKFLMKNNKNPVVKKALLEIAQNGRINEKSEFFPDEQIIAYIERLIDLDSKLGGLKKLEGLIWQEGYESGELKSEVYDDVPESLIGWKKSGKKVYIYSSGSVLAQKLLFKYSKFGNLTKYIDGYFDTEIGPKKDVKSYVNISNKLGVLPEKISFISDSIDEVSSSRNAGINSILIKRGNEVDDTNPVYFIIDFRSLC